MLTKAELERLDGLINQVSKDPSFITRHIGEASKDADLPFVLADVATSCALLMVHADDLTVQIINVAGGIDAAKEAEIRRRISFVQNSSLADLLEIRRRAQLGNL